MNWQIPALLAAVVSMPLAARADDFFQIKNENPLLRGIYLPLPADAARDAAAGFGAMLSAENTTNVENRGSEHLFVDGEALTLRLAYDARLGSDFRYRLSLPVTHDSGGVLDTAIERFHGWFGLTKGDRANYPKIQLTYSYFGNPFSPSTWRYDASPQTSIGDLAGEFGWYAADDPTRTLSLWGGVKAPTGKVSALTSNGAWDGSVWVHAAKRSSRWHFGAELGVVQPFGDQLFGGAAHHTSAFARGSVTWIAGPTWAWRAQVEGQTARIRDTELRFLGKSAVLSMGADVRLSRLWSLHWGLSEDVYVNSAPDVTFFVGVHRGAALR